MHKGLLGMFLGMLLSMLLSMPMLMLLLLALRYCYVAAVFLLLHSSHRCVNNNSQHFVERNLQPLLPSAASTMLCTFRQERRRRVLMQILQRLILLYFSVLIHFHASFVFQYLQSTYSIHCTTAQQATV